MAKRLQVILRDPEYREIQCAAQTRFAIMELHGIKQVFGFDSGFDGLPGIARIA